MLLSSAIAGLFFALPQGDPTAATAAAAAPAEPARIVLVRAAEPLADQRRFAQGLSASALAGAPVCMLVDDELGEAQLDLLRRLPAAELVCVGDLPGGLPEGRAVRRVAEPHELFAPVGEAVVASMHPHDQLEAAVEACRRRLPLLVADLGLAEQVDRLGVAKLRRFATRLQAVLPREVEVVERASDAEQLAALRGRSEPYLALANGGAARSFTSGTPLGAAALAAAHGGVLVVIDEPVEFDYAELSRRSPPEELAGHEAKEWLTGGFDLGDDEIAVAVPQVGSGPGLTGMVPRWGDPIVDLDRDGRLDPATETVTVGSVQRLEGRDWSVSLRLIGALGTTKFHDGQRVERIVRITPAAETIAAGLRRLYDESGVLPRHLLIAGDHREVPFDYVKDPVYANAIMHEQELASDNLYADPDGDGYLDIAVGRFVASSRVQATTLAARLGSHAHWRRPEEKPRAALIYPAWAGDELEIRAPMIFASFEALMRGVEADVTRAGFATDMHLREDGDLEKVLPSLPSAALVVFAHHSGPDSWQFRVHRPGGRLEVDLLVPRGRVDSKYGGSPVPFLAGAPLIVGAGCDSAGLDYEVVFETSIVHTFFEQGALGYVGNTRAGFPDTEEFLLRQMLQSALGMQPGTSGPMSVGEAFRQGKNYLDLLIRTRGPFRSVYPFKEYSLPMRREWVSLVYFGDPAMRLRAPASTPTVAAKVFEGGGSEIELSCDAPMRTAPVWMMGIVAVGPLFEVDAMVAPGLSYSSVPWATYADTRKPAIVGPGTFLDVAIPDAVGGEVELREGPGWAMGGARIVTDARGQRRLLLSVDFVRYAMKTPDEAERARRVVVGLK